MEIKARVPGTIEEILVKEGDTIAVGTPVVKLEAMKMLQEVRSPIAGEVTEISVEQGARVKAGAVLVVVE